MVNGITVNENRAEQQQNTELSHALQEYVRTTANPLTNVVMRSATPQLSRKVAEDTGSGSEKMRAKAIISSGPV
ncbi:hypothetical protein INR49_007045 [Caranx melampygus]|nr:hypothetical protein INR49_007045 [Caranx melampygus]